MNYKPVVLFFILLLVYSATTVPSVSGDTKPAALMPYTIIKYHTLYFDDVYDEFIKNDTWTYGFLDYNNHWVSIYPIVIPLLLTPLYMVYFLVTAALGTPFVGMPIMGKWFAALLCAFMGVVFYSVSRKVFSEWVAVVTTFVFALGTTTWMISSQQLWLHGLSELLICLGLLVVLKNEDRQDWKNYCYLGVIVGLFIINRPPDLLLILPFVAYVLYSREHIIKFAASVFAAVFPFLLYNYTLYGNVLGFYKEYSAEGFPILTCDNKPMWAIQAVYGFVGQWVSLNRGLFVFCPVLLFAIWGAYLVYKNKGLNHNIRRVLLWFIPIMVATVMVYSLFQWWDGGGSAGPRYTTGLLPVLAIYVGFALREMWIKKRHVLLGIFIFLFSLSIIIEATGAWGFAYSTWAQSGTTGMWNMSDSLIVNSYYQTIQKPDALWVMPCPAIPQPVGMFQVWKR